MNLFCGIGKNEDPSDCKHDLREIANRVSREWKTTERIFKIISTDIYIDEGKILYDLKGNIFSFRRNFPMCTILWRLWFAYGLNLDILVKDSLSSVLTSGNITSSDDFGNMFYNMEAKLLETNNFKPHVTHCLDFKRISVTRLANYNINNCVYVSVGIDREGIMVPAGFTNLKSNIKKKTSVTNLP